MTTLGQALRASLQKRDDALALIQPDGLRWTYAELRSRVDQVKEYFLEAGLRPGQRIGLYVPKRAETVAIIIAALEAHLPFIPCDDESPLPRARTIFSAARATLVFVEKSRLHEWELGPVTVARPFIGDSLFEAVVLNKGTEPVQKDQAEDLAYILYTSGSTGMPKGVQITHGNAMAFVKWAIDSFVSREGMAFSSIAPFHFDLSVFDIYASLITGGKLVLFDSKVIRNPRLVAQLLTEEGVNIIYATPTILTLLSRYGKLERLDHTGLDVVLFAGEVFPISALRELQTHWPQKLWYNLYGPTETNVVTYYQVPSVVEAGRQVPFPIGQPCPYVTFLLRDDEGNLYNEGQGELLIAGDSVTPGYLGMEADESVFLHHSGRIWYGTGDWVKVGSDGMMTFVGRRDGMVKRRGYRIELGEIESAYSQLFDGISVKALSIHSAGENIIVLVLSGEMEDRMSSLDLKTHGLKYLPVYMLPDHFVWLDQLPMTSSHKIDQQSLKQLISRELNLS